MCSLHLIRRCVHTNTVKIYLKKSMNGFTIYLLLTIILSSHFTKGINTKNKRSNINLSHEYHDYDSTTKFLHEFVSHYSDVASIYSIGKSVQNRELWVVKFSTNPTNETFKNNIKLIGNIHGNEVVGKEILLHFLLHLADNYERDERIKHILKHNNLHILPSLNPDGFERSVVGRCERGPGRTNARSVDLNRNFPDDDAEWSIGLQPETRAVLKWMNETKFILSASLHGGALVANYPLDKANIKEDVENITPDDDVFQHLALTYSKSHPTMHLGKPCSRGEPAFENGITNGAAWYSFEGGMQDYNYAVHGCMELTLEISCCKYPWPSKLRSLFYKNKDALIEYSLQSGLGIKGTIRNIMTNETIMNATLNIVNRNVMFFTSSDGNFFRILLPGKYAMEISALHYKKIIVNFDIEETKYNSYPEMTVLNIFLEPHL